MRARTWPWLSESLQMPWALTKNVVLPRNIGNPYTMTVDVQSLFISDSKKSWSDTIRRQRSVLTLAQVMACLTAPSHYLNQCWLIISRVLRESLISSKMFTKVITTYLKITQSTHWGRDKMAAIFQTTFSNAFFWMKMNKFRLRFHWRLFPMVQLTIFQHWFR